MTRKSQDNEWNAMEDEDEWMNEEDEDEDDDAVYLNEEDVEQEIMMDDEGFISSFWFYYSNYIENIFLLYLAHCRSSRNRWRQQWRWWGWQWRKYRWSLSKDCSILYILPYVLFAKILLPLCMFGRNYCCFNSFLQVSFMLIYIFYFLFYFKVLDLF